jgi:OmpA-OmpF porin, OOP family
MRLSKPVFWLLTLLWFAAATWWYGSCSKCTACANAALPPAPLPTINLPGFSVTDSSWALSTVDNLRFGKSGNMPVLGTNMSKIVDSLSVYLTNHPGKTITVTGYYNGSETNTTTFENLGLARADELKKILVGKGVAVASILTQSKMNDDLVFVPADTLVGGITMDISSAASPPKEDLFAPRTVYFNTGKNSLPVDASFTKYIEDAKTYLQNNPDKKLLVTGYTDNVGDAEKNMQLSANRAAFVKAELVKKGIASDRIESSGKGMNDPVADNTTASGRASNRRVTIQLQ